jgi:hypothetical protein
VVRAENGRRRRGRRKRDIFEIKLSVWKFMYVKNKFSNIASVIERFFAKGDGDFLLLSLTNFPGFHHDKKVS